MEQEVPIELKLRMEEGDSVSKLCERVLDWMSNEAEKEAPKASKRNRPPNNHHGQPHLATGPMLSKRGRGVPVAIEIRPGKVQFCPRNHCALADARVCETVAMVLRFVIILA
uniref:Uncharacterized protein n=1 Tax=Caenorhabditis japonica TaxID=281687 RepID=A0A8R1ET43_CAEJA